MPRRIQASRGRDKGRDNRQKLALVAQVQLQAAAEEGGAKGRRFSMTAYSGELISQWWSDLPMVVEMASLRLPSQSMPILYDHRSWDADWVAGRADSLRIENGRLLAEGPVYEATQGGQKVLLLADQGHEWQASIGADPGRLERIDSGTTVEVDGVTHTGPLVVARGFDLKEISFVLIGAARDTSAVVANGGNTMEFDTWVQSLGFDPAKLDDTQRANLQKMYAAEFPEEESGEDEEETTEAGADADEETTAGDDEEEQELSSRERLLQARRRHAAELVRIDAITNACQAAGRPTITLGTGSKRRPTPLAAHAIAQGWTLERTELEILRQRRPTQVDIVRDHDRDASLQAMQGAMLLRAGGRLDHPVYQTPRAIAAGIPEWLRAGHGAEQRQRAMEHAHRYSDLSMVDLCREACRLDGRDAPHGRSEMIRAAFSGGALTSIFTTNINAIILATYGEAPDSTMGWVREADVADFKVNERPRMTKGPALTKLPRGGEADHASRSDKLESYKIARYAKQFVVDEQDVIDDRFNALADMPVEMGLAAARLRPDLVYSILKANDALDADSVALFHNASHANTDTGAALALATLKAGATAIRLQRENGVNLNLQPTHLIVPTTLEFTARELVNSTLLIVTGTTDVARGNANVLTSLGLQIVADARLDNGVVDPDTGTSHSGDVNDWFLAAAMAHTIEVAYLRGTGRSPQVRSFVLERGVWGIGWDINMDIGAKALDYRGLYRGVG